MSTSDQSVRPLHSERGGEVHFFRRGQLCGCSGSRGQAKSTMWAERSPRAVAEGKGLPLPIDNAASSCSVTSTVVLCKTGTLCTSIGAFSSMIRGPSSRWEEMEDEGDDGESIAVRVG